ncbi:hypothetical protein [Anatilimnocola floriformis]|uniref:hypothetical protein n=1 Tax=Anatilimnocola floriformis TaxID=2948575 RepID=UPI0020C4DB49|nr:hypothetical protein [Anatilimnocola floriformis]
MVARKTPSLELIQIASPCTADWKAMAGDDRVRHCGDCQLRVYNISEMTRDEAEAFLAQREGRTCIRMFKRPDGTVITRDCPVGLAAVRAKVVRLSLATAGLMLAMFAMATAAFAKVPFLREFLAHSRFEQIHQQQVQGGLFMGDVCPPAPPMPTPPPTTPNAQPFLGGVSPPPTISTPAE